MFLLLGGHTEKLSGRSIPDNVVPMGSVPGQILRTLLRSADLALNPMRRGSGSNLKVAEAFAAAAAVARSVGYTNAGTLVNGSILLH